MTENSEIDGNRGRKYWRLAGWGAAALLLLLPLIAMQFTDEVNWDVADFLIFGAMLLGAGLAIEYGARRTGNTAYRTAVGVAAVAAFLLIWVNLAVGIIGSENNDANLMFGGVLAVGLIASLVARFKALGMSRAMFATAAAQVLVGAIALIAGWGSATENWPMDIIGGTAVFTAFWLASGVLFRNAMLDEGEGNAPAHSG